MMTTSECVVNRILELSENRKLTLNGLAYISGVPHTTLKNIIYGNSRNPGIVTIKKLCDGLNISLTEFFDTSSFRELEQEIR